MCFDYFLGHPDLFGAVLAHGGQHLTFMVVNGDVSLLW
jgi:hypothetical protein